jgi:hypothetical protein
MKLIDILAVKFRFPLPWVSHVTLPLILCYAHYELEA